MSIDERFWRSILVTDTCWLWTGPKNNKGYGRAASGLYAHRYAYEKYVGPTNGLHVLHKCDTPACVNPKHLFLGTQKDNMQDMLSKGKGRRYNTHCKHGHEFTAENTRIRKGTGQRVCRKCASYSWRKPA